MICLLCLDLETTEDETDDEDFYDEHPQKLAIQMFNEKRQQTQLNSASLQQTKLNPVNGRHPICFAFSALASLHLSQYKKQIIYIMIFTPC